MAKLTTGILSYFVKIIPSEETYFVSKTVPDTKLTKEMVQLNYGSLSPYKNGDILFFKARNRIYIWFTKNKLPAKRISIPEGFLLFKAHYDKKAIVILKKAASYNIVVIKNGVLLTQISKINAKGDTHFIEMLKKEYSLKNPEVITLEENNNLFKLNIKDLLMFFDSFNFNIKSFANLLYEQSKTPAIVLLILIGSLDLFTSAYLDRTLKNERIRLQNMKQSNLAIKKTYKTLKKQSQFWNGFIAEELRYPNLYRLLSAITLSILKNGSQINTIRQSSDSMEIWIASNSVTSLVDNLMATGYFDNIRVIRTFQSANKSKETVELELKLKKLNKNG